MINKIRYIFSPVTDPYINLGLEEYLLYHVESGECILYLWQNAKTVVIGKNQNSWKECKVRQLEMDGGKLARRLSGGGAVYHDLGNLNFTFLVREEDYNLNQQMNVILQATKKWGISAQKSGRNDITVEGRKISGNAFFSSQGYCYHHGTILVDVEMDCLTHYLNVSAEKIRSKGVESVKSRVVNLRSIQPDVSVNGMEERLIEAFGEVYGLEPQQLFVDQLPQQEIEQLAEKFSSWDWKYGRRIPFTVEMGKRFSWGDLSIQLNVDGGYIHEANVYSDGMAVDFISELPQVLQGKMFDEEQLIKAVGQISYDGELGTDMVKDIAQLIREELS